MYIKMKQSIVFIIFGLSFVSGLEILEDKPYCFQYRWLGPIYSSSHRHNCTTFKGVPCIEPLVNTTDSQPPNTTEFWENKDDEKLCVLTPENVCVSYTFMYNDAVVNTSKFCGKVVEDKTLPITSGCYTQLIEGYDVQVCVCQSTTGMIPCNSSIQNKYSIPTIFIAFSVFIATLRFRHMYIS